MQQMIRDGVTGAPIADVNPTGIPIDGGVINPVPPGGSTHFAPQPDGNNDKPLGGFLYGSGAGSLEDLDLSMYDRQTSISEPSGSPVATQVVEPVVAVEAPAPAPVQIQPAAPVQVYQTPSPRETDQSTVLWHQNQALQRDLEQARGAVNGMRMLDEFFAQHPDMLKQFENILQGQAAPMVPPSDTNATAQGQVAPPSKPDLAAFQYQQRLNQQMESMQNKIAAFELQTMLGDMAQRHGDTFDPVGTVAYARAMGTTDLELAHRTRLGDLYLQMMNHQRQQQAVAGQQQQQAAYQAQQQQAAAQQAAAQQAAYQRQQAAAYQPPSAPARGMPAMPGPQMNAAFTNGPVRISPGPILPGRQMLPSGHVETPSARVPAPARQGQGLQGPGRNRGYGEALNFAYGLAGV